LPAWTHGGTNIKVPQDASIDEYEYVLTNHDRRAAAKLRQINMRGIYAVDLANNSCTCEQWKSEKQEMPICDLRRVCLHIAKAIIHHKSTFDGTWNEWTLRVLYALESGASHRLVKSFNSTFLENGEEKFLAVYDNANGYVQLFGEKGGCYGYDSMQNRWGWGQGPDHPLEVKRKLRPWIEALDAKFKNGKYRKPDESV
jgi:hypothetical protein